MFSRVWNKRRSTPTLVYAYYLLDFFPGVTFLIKEGNTYFIVFSKYLLLDVVKESLHNSMGSIYLSGKCSKGYIYLRDY